MKAEARKRNAATEALAAFCLPLSAFFWAACLGLFALAAARVPQLPPETAKLAGIKRQAAENQSRLPNYTCLETVERSWRDPGSRRFTPIDVIRFEVAHVGGGELYSWPGARQLREVTLAAMIGFGAIGSGTFAFQARNILLNKAPVYRYVGEENVGGRRAVRYDYRVSLLSSLHTVANFGRSAAVAHHGSFWADSESLELIRITTEAEEIPPELRISSTFTQIEYEKMRIADFDFLLPRRVELRMVNASGEESRNVTQLSQCRKYAATSAVSFEAPPQGGQAGKARAITGTELPAGLFLAMELQTAIDSKTSAVGDPIEAKLQTDIMYEGKVLAPAGAVVRGRVRRLERLRGGPNVFLVGLEFNEIEFSNGWVHFQAQLRDTEQRRGLSWQLQPHSGSYPTTIIELPGVGSFFIRGSRVQLPHGFRMVWRTKSASGG